MSASLTRGIAEVDVGEPIEVIPSAGLDPVPAQFAVVEIQLELGTRAQRIGDAVAIEIEQAELWVVERERWRRVVFDESALALVPHTVSGT